MPEPQKVKIKVLFHDEQFPLYGRPDTVGVEGLGYMILVVSPEDTMSNVETVLDLPGVRDVEIIYA